MAAGDAVASLRVVCPHCHMTNRVKTTDLSRAPDCGGCRRPLFVGSPMALDEAQFDRHVGRSDLPVLIDFWAPWCGPCLQMAPQFAQAAYALAPQFRLAKVDTEAQPHLGARFNIRSIPTLAIFLRGHELARQSGALGTNDIVRWARSHAPA